MTNGPPLEIRKSNEEISSDLKRSKFTNIHIDHELELFSFIWAER